MTAQLLAADLATLIQDTKRKNADIRSAAEKSLADLKALPNTSEAQLAADLKRRPNFVRPLLLACASKNGKFAATAISSLQRLVLSNALAVETLKDTLEVLRECTGLTQDIQLKILQIIPSLLQNYGNHVQKDLLVLAVHICCILLASKTAVISNTAAATLQQLVVGVLGKVVKEDENAKSQDFVAEVPIEDGSISVMPAALDAYRLLDDVCLLLEGDRPAFLQPTSMSPNLGMELVEAMIASHPSTVASHPELVHILRSRLLPFVLKVISEPKDFPITVRALRPLPIVFSNMLSNLPSECELILNMLNHMLDREAAAKNWKRVLCMEVFRTIHNDASLMRSIYAHFDEQEGKRTVVKDHLAILVKLSSENPAVIGLGPQSTMPASSGQTEEEIDEMAAIQADGIGGTIGVTMTLRASTAPGISARLSTMRVPCLEQLDKSEAPAIPPAYLYTLALTCLNNFSENIARFLLPFTIPNESRERRRLKQGPQDSPRFGASDEERSDDQIPKLERTVSSSISRIPVNPLALEGNARYHQIKTSASMIENCWPALLAAYSTFFHAALDPEYYHALIRSFQKFTQIAGLLRLATPRDACLTALGKNAVPSSVVSIQTTSQNLPIPEVKDGRRGSKTPIPQTPVSEARQELAIASLNTRNLLCLRALLHLGIALGPVLQAAWSIILETLQQADLIINHVQTHRRHSRTPSVTSIASNDADLGDIGSEIGAVRYAATRMLESSADLPEEAFLDIVASMSSLLRNLTNSDNHPAEGSAESAGQAMITTAPGGSQDSRANLFVIENFGKIVEFNKFRFLEQTTQHNGWHIFVNSLLGLVSAPHFEADVRVRAAQALDDLVAVTALPEVSAETRDEMRQEGLVAISRQIEALNKKRHKQKSNKACELDIHCMLVETLRSLLEQFGDTLATGWGEVFTIVISVFEEADPQAEATQPVGQHLVHRIVVGKSPKLVRSAFGSLQLICSDFLASVPQECLTILLGAIRSFCHQQDEFNISLTSTSLFCNVADHLWPSEPGLNLQLFDRDQNLDVESIEIQSFENVKGEMLLRLLLHLVEVTVDERVEIRHGAMHSIFRIFDMGNEKLSPSDWMVCIRKVLLKLFSHNQASYTKRKEMDTSIDDPTPLQSWNGAANVLLDNTATLLAINVNQILKQRNFLDVWKELIDQLRALVDRQDLSLSENVYSALEKVLLEIESGNHEVFSNCAHLAWELWEEGIPTTHRSFEKHGRSNQAALSAYLHCLSALQPLLASGMNLEYLKIILERLRSCATDSSPTAYSDDSDSLTSLQAQIIDHLAKLNDKIPGSVSEIIMTTASFVTLAFKRDPAGDAKGGPTYVAISKAAMEVLQNLMARHVSLDEIYSNGSLLAAFQALDLPISLKYKWRAESKPPAIWQKATSTAISIIATTVPTKISHAEPTLESTELWSCIIDIANDIMAAKEALKIKPAMENAEDQIFDVTAFEKLYTLIVPTLGSSTIPDRLRRRFAGALFQNSLIHTPHPDDLPQKDSREILSSLSSLHIGRTNDLRPSRRSRMAYVCLDKLVDQVSIHDGSANRISLAQAAAPFLILRAGIVLKAYVLDQPLRGLMPIPASQKKELLYILRMLVELRSEPKAIPDAPGINIQDKKHLYCVYGLVNKALKVSRRDLEIHGALMKVVEVCSSDFGLE